MDDCRARVRIDDDRLAAFLDPLPAPGPLPSLAEIEAAAAEAGVVHGLLKERIEATLAIYGGGPPPALPLRIAEGTPPVSGRDGAFELQIGGPLEEHPESRVDFHERHRFLAVNRGERIALWFTEVEGLPGRAVDGSVLPAEPVKHVPFEAGDNVHVRELEDGCFSIEAEVGGAVVIDAGNRISVVDVVRIDGDVDFSTGNIDAAGGVFVKGSVRGSFRVCAAHDVVVQGTIEDAIVEAGGSVTVREGILGGGFGHVRAGRDVLARHAQNARIQAGGDVVLRDSDFGSRIWAGGAIRASAGHGRLSGGDYRAALGIVAREIGSPLGAITVLRVGLDAALEREIEAIRRQLGELIVPEAGAGSEELRESDLVAGRPMPEPPEVWRPRSQLAADLARLEAKRAALDARFTSRRPPCIEVYKFVYGGVAIAMRGARLRIQEQLKGRRFVFDLETAEIVAQ